MTSSPLTVVVSYEGQICVLAAIGDLDLTTAPQFARCASWAMNDHPDRLVFDLARLDFLDCAGARALAAAAAAAPAGCPVIVRSVSPPAARLLGLLGQNLERSPAGTAPGPAPVAGRPDTRDYVISPDRAGTWARSIRTIEEIAATEDRVAATFARLAVQMPHRAAQLTAVSQSARSCASRARQWAHSRQELASPLPPP
jgi:anti-anti-sigma factor